MSNMRHESTGLGWLHHLPGELRYAARRLVRDAPFSLLAVVILGTALGANAALFAFLSGYFLKPLPIARVSDHVEVRARDATGALRSSWDLVEVDHVRSAGAAVLEHVYGAAERRAVAVPVGGAEPVSAFGAVVTNEYFTLLQPRLAMGRIPWMPDGADRSLTAVVLSDAGWRRLAGARSDALGQPIRIDGAFFEIAGVMAPEVTGLEPIVPDFWLAAGAYERALASDRRPRLQYCLGGLVRSGVARSMVADALTPILTSLPPVPAEPPLAAAVVLDRPTLLRERMELVPLAVILLAAFALMTLVASANLSGLYLARAAARTRDVALRVALGASRMRVIRPLLFESLILAGLGGVAGCLIAAWTVELLHGHVFSLVTTSGLTVPPVQVDWRVLAYVMGLAVVIGAASTLTPAFAAIALQPATHPALGGSLLRGDARHHRTLRGLVIAQAAISVALLVAAGMVVKNASNAGRADTGYDLAPLVDLAFERATPAFIERLTMNPHVDSASTVANTPLAGQAPKISVGVDGQQMRVGHNVVDHRFFDVTGIAIRRGRDFLSTDAAPGVRRVVVSEATARALWPGVDPVGRLVEIDEARSDRTSPERYEVIGVAADAISGFFFEGRESPMVYLTAPVASPRTTETIVRVRLDVGAALQSLRAQCHAYDPASMCNPMTLQALLDRQQVPFVIAAQVASGLGLITLVLACLGLYGLVSYTVVQRTRDIGVRMALGAARRAVLLDVLRGAAGRMMFGAALGLPACVGLLALLESRVSLFDTVDLRVYALAPAILVGAGVLAALIPARRAASVDPLVALRHE
jgi:predicted permease